MSIDTITAYDASTKKIYLGFGRFGKCNVTSVKKIGQLVDSEWHYSMHWPTEIDDKWKGKVQEDINTELEYTRERLKELEFAQAILDKIKI